MSAMTAIDTHALASRYKAAGFAETQVEAMVTTARETANLPDISQLVTKEHFDSQIAVTKEHLDAKIGRLDAKIDVEVGRLDAKIERLDAKIDQLRMSAKADLDAAKVQMLLAMDAIVGFVDGVLFFALSFVLKH